MKATIAAFIFFIIFSCSQSQEKVKTDKGKQLITHSQNLSIEDFGTYYKVSIVQPRASESISFTYILFRNDSEKPSINADEYISIPVKRVISTSTSHLPPFVALNESEALVGFANTQLIYDKNLLELVQNGKLENVGQKNGVNIEKVLSLQPDILMAYSMGSSMEQFKPLQKAGVPVLLNSDYLENSPLGRAEWLKLTAILIDKYKEGDSIFTEIEANYRNLQSKVIETKSMPSVMTGLMYGDVWYVPGGKSYAAQFIIDAGGNYLWTETPNTGSLELSFETVYSKAQRADFWIGAASFTSLKELKTTNDNYALFDAYQENKIYSYTKRVNENGANDYLESGYMRPDWILKDYINLIHPNILEDSTLTYFQRLK